MDKKIAIIILNFNSYKETKKLVESIKKHEKKSIYDIIIVDNSVDDKERIKIKEIKCTYKLFLNENLGYASGNNTGIKFALEKKQYDYFLIANSDTEVIEDDTIYNLCDAMEKYNAGVIGPQIIDADNKPTAGAGYINFIGKVKNVKCNEPRECQGLIGAFFIIKSDVINKCGIMNEKFFLYLEETDYFYRLWKSGVEILYYPKVEILHYGGTTTSKVYDFYITRNRFLLVKNNFKTPHICMCLVLLCECIFTDLKQCLACFFKLRNYDYKFRRVMRWKGLVAGFFGEEGKTMRI